MTLAPSLTRGSGFESGFDAGHGQFSEVPMQSIVAVSATTALLGFLRSLVGTLSRNSQSTRPRGRLAKVAQPVRIRVAPRCPASGLVPDIRELPARRFQPQFSKSRPRSPVGEPVALDFACECAPALPRGVVLMFPLHAGAILHAAYNRIEAARAAQRFPAIRELLADGRVHLSAVRLLSPHLTEANHRVLLVEASRKSKRQIEEIVARLQPRADAPSSVRKVPSLPAPTLTSTSSVAKPDPQPSETPVDRTPVCTPRREKVEPLAPGRYKVQFTVTSETYEKFRRAQDLLRHRVPNGDPAAIFDRALTVLLDMLDKQRLAATAQPRAVRPAKKLSRHVPAAVRREVWARDQGRCKFEGPAGRCQETGFLEIHRVVPYASGGPTTVGNLELRCAAHNRYEAEQHFGLFVRERQSDWCDC